MIRRNNTNRTKNNKPRKCMHVIHIPITYANPCKKIQKGSEGKGSGEKRVPTSLLPTIPFQFQKFQQFISLVQFQFKNNNV